jgi:hypothetical protein
VGEYAMKRLIVALMACVLCLGTGALTFAGHHEKGHGQEGRDPAEAGMPPMGPPEELKQVEVMNGEYDVKFFYKMDPMNEEWTETRATAVLRTVAGGGAQQMPFDGEMMGMPFSGMGLTTYDRETKQWQMTWVDSMGARISMYTGDFKDGKMVVTGKDLGQGMTYHSRLTTYNITDKGFEWKYEMSMDGTNYMDTAKATYTKK